MAVKVRTRLLLWLLLATLPIFAVGIVIVDQVTDGLSNSIERNLENLVQLEAARINRALVSQEISAAAMVARPELISALETAAAQENLAAGQLDVVADGLVAAEADVAQTIEDVRILDRDGVQLGESSTFSWEPDPRLALRAMEQRVPIFGDAFLSGIGDERIGLAVPVVTADGSVVGAVLVENQLGPIVELAIQHESFGETSEAILVQADTNGNATLITNRRFERDSAFRAVLPGDALSPSARSLVATETEVVRLIDYRGQETIAAIQPIDATGWGLAIKIDSAEAFALSNRLSMYIIIACSMSVLVVALGWFAQLQPLGRRLQKTATASERLAGGDHDSLIGDTARDEIGELARGIDRLATDLKADIAARRAAENQLRYQANHDQLTELINRQRATAVIEDLGPDAIYSVLFIDLDGFKQTNDTYGHAVGDQVLIAVASRLSSRLDPSATLARWGGDEFVVILPGVNKTAAAKVATKLGKVFDEPVASKVGKHNVGASIGVASSGDERPASQVLLEADAAMFKAKHKRATYRQISPATVRMVEEALLEDRVEAFFQPVVKFDETGEFRIYGAEALARIRAQDGSIVPPGDFIPSLGASELSALLDARIAEKAFANVGRWLRRGVVSPNFRIALNAGPASIEDPGLLPRLVDAMATNGIDAQHVVIEIPESVEVVGEAVLEGFRSTGFAIAIDDVGVQYSNLERMMDLKADIAKLDRRWIPDLATSESPKSEVLRGLIGQCQTLKLDVIAEGVETEHQLTMLRELDVEVFQGFLFGKPVSPIEFEQTWGHAISNVGAASASA